MGADEDASDANEGRSREKDRPNNSIEQKDCEGDSKRGASVIAWERRVVRATAPHVRPGVCRERSLAMPAFAYHLIDEQRHRSGTERTRRCDLPLPTTARASQKPECESGHSHDWDSPFLSDAQTTPEPGMVEHELVDRVIDPIVDSYRPP